MRAIRVAPQGCWAQSRVQLIGVLAGHQRIVVDTPCAEGVWQRKRNTGRVEGINTSERLDVFLQSGALVEGIHRLSTKAGINRDGGARHSRGLDEIASIHCFLLSFHSLGGSRSCLGL